MTSNLRSVGYVTAVSVAVADMIGTGVFTSLGFQVVGTRSGFALLAIWAVGGLVALCGALSYAELGATIPRSGGEYHFLRRIYHPVLGLLGGWATITVAHAAPIALSCIALGTFAQGLIPGSPRVIAVTTLAVVSVIHAVSLRLAQAFQVSTTGLKVVLIIGFVAVGLALPVRTDISFLPTAAAFAEISTPAFAVSLIYVSYAFSGWNAAAYMVGELKDPQRTLPRAMLHATLLVTVMYLALNWTFLRAVPIAEMAGKVEVGGLAAAALLGANGGRAMNGMIALVLLSSVSAMTFAGPRITQVIGEDLPALGLLARRTAGGVPRNALVMQQLIALAFILTGAFEPVLTYAGFTMNLFSMLVVLGVFVLRWREPGLPRPYRTWGYPVTPAIFIALSLWTLGFVAVAKPREALLGFATVASGLFLLFFRRVPTSASSPEPSA